jgi:hypothetical protein
VGLLRSLSAERTEVQNPDPTGGASLRRVEAGRQNRTKRGALTSVGLQRLRDSAVRTKPWVHSTGPRTEAGKARVAMNGRKRQKGCLSVRDLRASVSDVNLLIRRMKEHRGSIRQSMGSQSRSSPDE